MSEDCKIYSFNLTSFGCWSQVDTWLAVTCALWVDLESTLVAVHVFGGRRLVVKQNEDVVLDIILSDSVVPIRAVMLGSRGCRTVTVFLDKLCPDVLWSSLDGRRGFHAEPSNKMNN